MPATNNASSMMVVVETKAWSGGPSAFDHCQWGVGDLARKSRARDL